LTFPKVVLYGGLAIIALALIAALQVGGSIRGENWTQVIGDLSYCTFQLPTCSVAPATWLLATLTGCAFVAAAAAALFAGRLYELEARPAMGLMVCRNHQHAVSSPVAHLRLDDSMKVSRDEPERFDEYAAARYELRNLGRSTLRRVSVSARFLNDLTRFARSEADHLVIGSITVDDPAHVLVYVSKALPYGFRVQWENPRANGQALDTEMTHEIVSSTFLLESSSRSSRDSAEIAGELKSIAESLRVLASGTVVPHSDDK